jgi:3-deoxy-D-manno-octulosonic-acid transferase
MLLYSLALAVALILASPYWLFRMLRGGRYRAGLRQRLGMLPSGLHAWIAGRPVLWLHAVSVGEILAASRLVELLDTALPSTAVVISTTTATGQQLAQKRFGAERVFYYPLDFGWIVRRVLRALRPQAIVLMESELWPRMIYEADRSSIPVVVVNARVSDRSLPRYRALRTLWRPFLRCLTLVLAQSEQDAARLRTIGVPAGKIQISGNLKYDVRPPVEATVTEKLREYLAAGVNVVVAGSTLAGEETWLLRALQELSGPFPSLLLILAPRHPERFDAAAQEVANTGLPLLRRSQWMQNPAMLPAGCVFLLDSIGELASVYSLATIAFVGGSLFPTGGHNPLEPAQFGKPIVTGPYTENFRGMVAAMLAEEAIRITPPERLAHTLEELLNDPAEAVAMGVRGQQFFAAHAGASKICEEAIQKILTERKFAREDRP